MFLKKLIIGGHMASAKVADGRLILSLPDAETPVVWALDLKDMDTAVLRVEHDKQGLYILRKLGGKSGIETIAVYRARDMAVNGLMQATHALASAKTQRSIDIPEGRRKPAMTWLTYFLIGWFLLYLSGFDRVILRAIFAPSSNNTPVAAAPENTSEAQPPVDAVGVPLSADAFLKQQQRMPLP